MAMACAPGVDMVMVTGTVIKSPLLLVVAFAEMVTVLLVNEVMVAPFGMEPRKSEIAKPSDNPVILTAEVMTLLPAVIVPLNVT